MNPGHHTAILIEEGEAFRTLSEVPVARAARSLSRKDRTFHALMSVAFLVTAFAGFAPTYFLRGFSDRPPLSPLLHIHGLVFTAWLILLVVQSGLIKADRVDLHKRLGILGATLAAFMVPLAMMVAIQGVRHGVTGATGDDPLVFLIFPIGQALMFGVAIAGAIWKRRAPEIHRRLILVSAAILITPAISRLPFGGNPVVSLVLTSLFVVAGMIHDWKSGRRVHPIYMWSTVLILVSGPVRFALGHTEAWQSFARFLAG